MHFKFARWASKIFIYKIVGLKTFYNELYTICQKEQSKCTDAKATHKMLAKLTNLCVSRTSAKNGNFFAKFLFTFFANFLFATTRLFNRKATKKLLQRVVGVVFVTVVVTDVVNY